MGPPTSRDEAWFTAMYSAHYSSIVKYGVRRMTDRHAAAELAQEVFVVAWRRRAQVPGNSLPWLYGVARHLLANRWRAKRGAPQIVPLLDVDLPLPASDDAQADVAAVAAALRTLSETDQEIVRLIGWEELTLAEAALALGCTRPTAAVRLHRARRRLSAALDRSAVRPLPLLPLAAHR